MTEIKELKIQELWENKYKEYVKNQFMTKIEALIMIANELGIYFNNVINQIDNIEIKTKENKS